MGILWVGGWQAEDKGISQEDPQLPQSLREALQPDYNLPDVSCICCHEITNLTDPLPVWESSRVCGESLNTDITRFSIHKNIYRGFFPICFNFITLIDFNKLISGHNKGRQGALPVYKKIKMETSSTLKVN